MVLKKSNTRRSKDTGVLRHGFNWVLPIVLCCKKIRNIITKITPSKGGSSPFEAFPKNHPFWNVKVSFRLATFENKWFFSIS